MPTDVDLSEFFKLSRPKKPPCRIGFILGQVSRPKAAQLAAACATDTSVITTSAIIQWLAQHGHEGISVPAVTTHRKKTCNCGT